MFKGLNLMGQIKDFQNKMTRLEEELESKTVEVSAGGGMVTVTANGKKELVNIKIDPQVVNPEEVEMLEDLILAAANEALRRAQEMVAEEVTKLAGEFNIPGLKIPGLTS